MLTVKSQQKKSETPLATSRSNQSYKMQLLPFDSSSIHHFYNNFPPFNTSSIFDKHVSSQLPVCFLPFGAVHHLLPSMLSHSDVADLPS